MTNEIKQPVRTGKKPDTATKTAEPASDAPAEASAPPAAPPAMIFSRGARLSEDTRIDIQVRYEGPQADTFQQNDDALLFQMIVNLLAMMFRHQTLAREQAEELAAQAIQRSMPPDLRERVV